MVKTALITKTNERFAGAGHEGLVCVFMGATSGIGLATLHRLLTMLHSSTVYVLGRNLYRYASRLDQFRELSPSSKIIFIETQVSLISGIDTACDQIKLAERKIDIVCMSASGMPFQGAVYTIIFGMSVKESGERHAYYLTSDTYRPGSWCADKYNELKPDSGVSTGGLQESGKGGEGMGTYTGYLGQGSSNWQGYGREGAVQFADSCTYRDNLNLMWAFTSN